MNEEIDYITVNKLCIAVYYPKGRSCVYSFEDGYKIDEFESGLIVIELNHKPFLLVSIHRIKHLRYI